MADTIVPSFDGDNELEDAIAAELSKNDDLVDYIQVNSLDALKARFGAAEEDERIRNEGFELAKKGGLIKKPKPESFMTPYGAEYVKKSEDIQTESESELSKMFNATKSEYDSTTVEFEDLNLNKKPVKTVKEIKAEEPVKEEPVEEKPQAPPKRKRGRPRKNPLPPEPVEEKKTEEKKEEPATAADDGEYELVKKYNTHTKVIFSDEYIDDGIKRNSESELEHLFTESSGGRRRKLWSPKKK